MMHTFFFTPKTSHKKKEIRPADGLWLDGGLFGLLAEAAAAAADRRGCEL